MDRVSRKKEAYAALIGIDWADQQHDYCLGEGTFDYHHGPLFIDENFAIPRWVPTENGWTTRARHPRSQMLSLQEEWKWNE